MDVSTDWSNTEMLNGEVVEYATIARKDRHSEDRYLGSISNEQGKSRDDEAVHWRTAPNNVAIEERKVADWTGNASTGGSLGEVRRWPYCCFRNTRYSQAPSDSAGSDTTCVDFASSAPGVISP